MLAQINHFIDTNFNLQWFITLLEPRGLAYKARVYDHSFIPRPGLQMSYRTMEREMVFQLQNFASMILASLVNEGNFNQLEVVFGKARP